MSTVDRHGNDVTMTSGAPGGQTNVPSGQRGFTLLELLISLTILSVIVVIMFGALRIGVRAWEKGERDLDRQQKQRIVLDLVKRQLASTVKDGVAGTERQSVVSSPGPGGPGAANDQRPVAFKGDDKSIEFVSRVPLTPGTGFGMVHVRYAVKRVTGEDREELAFYEENAAVPAGTRGGTQPDEKDFSGLIAGMKSIVFEYLKDRPEGEASRWEKSWDPAVDKGVPRAVRVTFDGGDGKAPIYVIAGAGA